MRQIGNQAGCAMLVVAVALVFRIQGARAETLTGTPRIVDGDTLELGRETIRLHGIDAPEAGQKCKAAKGRSWPCGEAAIDALAEMIEGKAITCEGSERDPYNRLIARCRIEDLEVNSAMVERGHAWAFVRYSRDYEALQQGAREACRGVWEADTPAPWDYRAEQWRKAEPEAPRGCPIKGNISRDGERIYHVPWSPWYTRTKVNEAAGERWFCDEAEALRAGWRAPRWR
jgi:endonuclease YncB( thermonuclease family)